jgi:hypothetical protein
LAAGHCLLVVVVAVLLTAGCDPLSWANFNLNIVIPLGLGGDTGLFNPPEDGGSIWPWFPFGDSSSTDPGSGGSATESAQ